MRRSKIHFLFSRKINATGIVFYTVFCFTETQSVVLECVTTGFAICATK